MLVVCEPCVAVGSLKGSVVRVRSSLAQVDRASLGTEPMAQDHQQEACSGVQHQALCQEESPGERVPLERSVGGLCW